MHKICTKCGIDKPYAEFYGGNHLKDKISSLYRECTKKSARKWSAANPEKKKEIEQKYQAINFEKKKKTDRKRYALNPEKYREAAQRWQFANPERRREIRQKADRSRRSIPKNKISRSISGRIWVSIKKGAKLGRHWESLVDFTINELRSHLEKLFKPGMTWDNYGEWHIDHKTPIASFNFEKPGDIDFKRCWSLKNLQPLWAEENFKKGARL